MSNLSEEEKEAIETLKIIKNDETIKYYYTEKTINDIDIVLNLIDKQEKELKELKGKNKALEYIENKLMPLAECSYWNYRKHTCTHTCRGCDYLNESNRRTESGVLINKDRYCRLYEDGNCEQDTKFVNVQDLISRHWKGE